MTDEALTPTPPMGWNSWDCFGPSVTEDEVRRNAEFIAEHLAPYGWQYVVVDIQWYEPLAGAGGYRPDAELVLDRFGRPWPAVNRFPSAGSPDTGPGFAPLAEFVQSLGLRFGVHIMRGIPRQAVRSRLPIAGTPYTADQVADLAAGCAWNTDNVGLNHDHPGAQAYYDSLLAQFAAWGVDFVKADDMIAPYREAEVAAFATAVRHSGRPMVLSLSPGTALASERVGHLAANAQMWRISDDLWDRWSDVAAQFDRLANWARYAGPDSWPDADMLPIGRVGVRAEVGEPRDSRFTRAEQITMLTLWCIARSPLMVGADLPGTDPATIALLTNPEVIAVNRESRGAREVYRDPTTIAWTAVPDPSGDVGAADGAGSAYLAVFNLADQARTVELPWSSLGLQRPTSLRDLWQRESVSPGSGASPDADVLRVSLDPHGAALLRVHGAFPAATP
jgi:alpha-galactosidase